MLWSRFVNATWRSLYARRALDRRPTLCQIEIGDSANQPATEIASIGRSIFCACECFRSRFAASARGKTAKLREYLTRLRRASRRVATVMLQQSAQPLFAAQVGEWNDVDWQWLPLSASFRKQQ